MEAAIPRRAAWAALLCAHTASALFLFGGALRGRVGYFRDLSLQFAPDYAVVEAALRRGVWPLWNPASLAGEPMLPAYPVDLLLLLVGGPRAPLGPGLLLHLLLALAGGSFLARRLGAGPAGAWLAGTVYGVGGLALSTVDLLPLFHAVAWAPWVAAAVVGVAREPRRRRVALLGLLAAVQVSTLGAEIVLQTWLAGLVLGWGRARARRALVALGGAAALAVALAAPAVLGVLALLRGSARLQGFAGHEALAFSLHPVVLAEALLPKLLGEPHAFSDATNWAAGFFPAGHPYFVSLYLGAAALLPCLLATGGRRLWALAALGVALALGSHGPLGLLERFLALPLRGPQKAFFLVHVALALLAGLGLSRALAAPAAFSRRRLWLLVPGAALLAAALVVRADPEILREPASGLIGALAAPRALEAAARWPAPWLAAGGLALAAGLALLRGGRLALLAGALATVDLLVQNAGVNPLAPSSFYELRPDVAALVRPRLDGDRHRIFSYGVAYTPGLRFEPVMARATSDAWLFYLDRQSLLPRTPALDGWESAFGVDRTGWAPPGSTLGIDESRPDRFAAVAERLRLANVRYVLSYRSLPGHLVAQRGAVKLPELAETLKLYELREPLPRAFLLTGASVAMAKDLPLSGAYSPVSYEAIDPHTVRVRLVGPAGLVVVLDGYHPDWVAEDSSGAVVPLERAFGRYRAFHTPGGERVITLRYCPRWRGPALALSAAALAVAIGMAVGRPRRVSDFTGARAQRVLDSPRNRAD